MLTLTQQGQNAASPATVQTPDSANLKVNQVFEITFSCLDFFPDAFRIIGECCFLSGIQASIYIHASLIVYILMCCSSVALICCTAKGHLFCTVL